MHGFRANRGKTICARNRARIVENSTPVPIVFLDFSKIPCGNRVLKSHIVGKSSLKESHPFKMKKHLLNSGLHYDLDDELNVVLVPHVWLVPLKNTWINDPCNALTSYNSYRSDSILIHADYDTARNFDDSQRKALVG